MTPERLSATYHLISTADAIEARALALAVEQSVEMPLAPIANPFVRDQIVGRVDSIRDLGDGSRFEVRLALSVASTGAEAGQLFNMLFGNSSIHDDVTLWDVELPPGLAAAFGGPRQGLAGWRRRFGTERRALAASALKPQGLPSAELARLAHRLALGGLDLIKDDHGLADQAYAPFAERVPAVAEAIAAATAETGVATRYAPSLSGNLDQLRRQVTVARAAGLDTLLVTPLVIGLPAFVTLVQENPDLAFLAHPALAGACRIAPPLLLGKLFRLLGADGVIFPNHGGRFGYSPATCRALAETARAPWPLGEPAATQPPPQPSPASGGGGKEEEATVAAASLPRLRERTGEGLAPGPQPPLAIAPALPVPAGGMTLARVPELQEFYGPLTMLLIGGDLLAAGEALTERAAAFRRALDAAQGAGAPGSGGSV